MRGKSVGGGGGVISAVRQMELSASYLFMVGTLCSWQGNLAYFWTTYMA